MSKPLDDLRRELSETSTRMTRFAITSILIVGIASLTFARAVRQHQREINTLISQVSDLIGEAAAGGSAASTRVAEIHKLVGELSASFDLDLPLGGFKIQFNLLYWFVTLPFVILGSFAYLGIVAAKMKALQTIAAARIRSGADGDDVSPVERLTFGRDAPTAYALYPSRLGIAAYLGIMVCLILNMVVPIVSIDTAFVIGELLRHFLILAFYFWWLTRAIRRRILREGAVIAGERYVEKPHRLEGLRAWLKGRARRWWRGLAFGGSSLTVSTLFLMTAGTSRCSEPRTGAQLFLGKDGAMWPPVDDFFVQPIYRIDSLGRFVYIAAIIAAAVACVLVPLTLIPRINRWAARQEWLWDALRAVAVVVFFFVICAFGFVVVFIAGLPALLPPAWQIVYWVIPSLLYVWMTVVRKRKWREKWNTDVLPVIRVLYAPAWLIAPLGVAWHTAGYRGTAVFAVGALFTAVAFVNRPGVVPAATEERAEAAEQEPGSELLSSVTM